MDNQVNEVLIPCKECGRSFREEALIKHAKICKKVFKQKRKKFDTKKKRIIDSEHAMLLKYADKAENNPKLKQVRERKKNNWKIQSEQLRGVARANRMMSVGSGGGYSNHKVSGQIGRGNTKNSGYGNNMIKTNNNGYSGGNIGKKTVGYGQNNYDQGFGGMGIIH